MIVGRKVFGLFAGCLMFAACLVHEAGANEDPDDPYKALVELGTITSKNISDEECKVSVVMDFEKSKQNVALFREEWLNREKDIDFYTMRWKQFFSYIVVKRFAELITESLYRDSNSSKVDHCSFDIKISADDKFGQSQLHPAVTWEFDRNVANRINWEKFDPRNFQDVALNYHVDNEIEGWTADEPVVGGLAPSLSNQPKPPESCDWNIANANAIFMRATIFCKKDYLDTQAGYIALAEARKCFSKLGEDEIKSLVMKTMLQVDALVKAKGRKKACRWIDAVERKVLSDSGAN